MLNSNKKVYLVSTNQQLSHDLFLIKFLGLNILEYHILIWHLYFLISPLLKDRNLLVLYNHLYQLKHFLVLNFKSLLFGNLKITLCKYNSRSAYIRVLKLSGSNKNELKALKNATFQKAMQIILLLDNMTQQNIAFSYFKMHKLSPQ